MVYYIHYLSTENSKGKLFFLDLEHLIFTAVFRWQLKLLFASQRLFIKWEELARKSDYLVRKFVKYLLQNKSLLLINVKKKFTQT